MTAKLSPSERKKRAKARAATRRFRAEARRLPAPGAVVPRQLSLDAFLTGYRHAGWEGAGALALKAAFPSWNRLRALVYERDHGICWVCGKYVPEHYYELGHIVDRMMGGTDAPENVAVMCVRCNRVNKVLHSSVEESLAWRDSWVDPRWKIIEELVARLSPEEIDAANRDFAEQRKYLAANW